MDYFLGKLGVIAALVAVVAVGPAAAAYVLGVCFSLDLTVIRDTWRLLPASILYGLVIVLSAGTLMLALSSLSRRSIYVGIAWIGLWVVSLAVAGVLSGIQRAAIWQAETGRANVATAPDGQNPDQATVPRRPPGPPTRGRPWRRRDASNRPWPKPRRPTGGRCAPTPPTSNAWERHC